jgi:hypothetical protein
MRRQWLIFTLLISLAALGPPHAYAQTAPSGNLTPANKPGAPASNVAADAPVITIDGLCGSDPYSIAEPDPASKPSSDSKAANSTVALNPSCRTIITRSQFEGLAGVVAPNQPPQADVQLARLYSEQLLFAREARALGLDKDPHFNDILKFTYLQVLARAMNNHLQEQAEMSDAEFKKYYQEHAKEFEEVQLLQISIPKQKQHPSASGSAPPSKAVAAADEAAMKAEAETIYRQVLAGGDFEKLQEEAYTVAGDPDAAPDSDMGLVTRPELGESQAEIFALKPGQISRLISGQEAWHVFKVVSKQMMPENDARNRVSGQRVKAATEALKDSVKPKLNDAYFWIPAGSEAAKSTEDETH